MTTAAKHKPKVSALGRMPRSNQREIFKALGSNKCFVVISFAVDDVKVFDGYEDGTVRNWTPLFRDRHAWDANGAMRNFGMEVV